MGLNEDEDEKGESYSLLCADLLFRYSSKSNSISSLFINSLK